MLLLGVLWLALVLVSLSARTLFPVDETRYASVAWEMWTSGEWLVPHLNGEPYSHKPPLLFWMIIIGWRAVGENDWWPRLLSALFVAGSLPLTAWLARRLWPSDKRICALAPWILFGSLLAAYCSSTLMFDSLVLFFTLLAMTGTLLAASGRSIAGWALFALAVGLGMLSKGPVLLIHAVPVALLAPIWIGNVSRPSRMVWYAALGAALIVGSAITLAWALPAAAGGGEAYGRAIIWSQTAHRVVDSFAHAHPFWWYIPWLFAVLFPWAVWPALWRALSGLFRSRLDRGTRFCLCWLLPTFTLLSSISGKQPQYLLSLLPGAALIAARALSADPPPARPLHRLPALVSYLGLSLFFLFVAFSKPLSWLPAWTAGMPAWVGCSLVLLALALLLVPPGSSSREVRLQACTTVLMLVALNLGPVRLAMPAHDVRPVSAHIRAAQEQGRPVAHVGNYEGQFHFQGRLSLPFEVIGPDEVESWAGSHPDGLLISYSREWMAPREGTPEMSRPYRGRIVSLWASPSILARRSSE
jgi:4-amino-4-deoxy-L-arabinose transferase-like glycosyltransferase